MYDLHHAPAFWGVCGGLFYGSLGIIAAYSAKVGTPLARRRALMELAVGALFSPITAEAFTGMVMRLIPVLDMRAVALTIGLLTVPYAPQYIASIKRKIDERLGGRE